MKSANFRPCSFLSSQFASINARNTRTTRQAKQRAITVRFRPSFSHNRLTPPFTPDSLMRNDSTLGACGRKARALEQQLVAESGPDRYLALPDRCTTVDESARADLLRWYNYDISRDLFLSIATEGDPLGLGNPPISWQNASRNFTQKSAPTGLILAKSSHSRPNIVLPSSPIESSARNHHNHVSRKRLELAPPWLWKRLSRLVRLTNLPNLAPLLPRPPLKGPPSSAD